MLYGQASRAISIGEKGRAAVAAWFEQRGLYMPGLFIDNGSGLSRRTRVTAAGFGVGEERAPAIEKVLCTAYTRIGVLPELAGT